jgi:hypothetical protein
MAVRISNPKQAAPALMRDELLSSEAGDLARTRLLTTQEVAAILAVSPRTLEGWRMTGEGPDYLRISRSSVRYAGAAVEAFIQAARRHNTVRQ